jgi:hypothetical protein
VLASAGIGSLYSRVFSSRHGEEVRGILMIDPMHEDLLSRVGAPGRGFMLWLQGVISPCGLDRLPGVLLKGRSAADRVWGRSAYQSGGTIFAKLQESLVANSLTKRDVVSSRTIQNKDTPVVVISSGVQIRTDSEWEDKVTSHRDLGIPWTQLTFFSKIATRSNPSYDETGRLGCRRRGTAPGLEHLGRERGDGEEVEEISSSVAGTGSLR